MRPDPALVRFVRGLVGGVAARRREEHFVLPDGRRAAAVAVADLVASGAIDGNGEECRSNDATRAWLRRAMAETDSFAAQHRQPDQGADGTAIDLSESPLSRLAQPSAAGPAFLERHQVEAGERVRRLIERAGMQPRVTMAYGGAGVSGGGRGRDEISDMAADARRKVANLYQVLPRDCADVVVDVCGLLKGLQDVERDRGWPRRSAKLVLRIALDQLSRHYGIGMVAEGPQHVPSRAWLGPDARPQRFE